MLDLKLGRDNPDAVREGLRKRGAEPALVDRVLEADRRRGAFVQDVERLRAEQNRGSAEIPKLSGEEKPRRIAEMREVSSRLKGLEPDLRTAEEALHTALLRLPNLPHPSVPAGVDPADNIVVRTWGQRPEFDFPPRVLLEQALIRFALDSLLEAGFTPVQTPFLVRPEVLMGAYGGADLDTQQVYRIEGEDLALIGTSEQSLAGLYKEETLEEKATPLRLAGVSWWFRRGAGSDGEG